MTESDADQPQPKEGRPSVLVNKVMTGQLLPLVPAFLMLFAVVKGIAMAGYAFSNMQAQIAEEQAARIASQAEIKQELEASTDRLGAKIDANARLEEARMSTMSDKIVAIGSAVDGIAKASTPSRR